MSRRTLLTAVGVAVLGGAAAWYLTTSRIWMAPIINLIGPERPISAPVFSADGTRVVTAGMTYGAARSWDGIARIWDAASGKQLQVLRHGGYVSSASFSPDGKWVVTAGSDNTARIWDAGSGQLLRTFRHESLFGSVSWSPDGKRLGTAGLDRTARIWDAESGLELQVLRVSYNSYIASVIVLLMLAVASWWFRRRRGRRRPQVS